MKRSKTKLLFVVCGLVITIAQASFAGGVGTTGAQFLKIGSGARPASMAGAFSAVADDVNAIYYNPAGLAAQTERQGTASYIKYFQGVNIGFLGYTQKLGCCGTFGVGIDYLTIGDIERRTTDVDKSEGSFGATDIALLLSYGDNKVLGNVVKGLSVGATVKIIKQTIDTENAQSYALDVGTLYQTPIDKLTASLGVYNIGSGVKFVDTSDPLPLDIKLGGAYRVLNDTLLFAFDVNDYTNDERLYTQVGAEYLYKKIVSVRAGYTMGMDSSKLGGSTGLSTGFGIALWNVKLDYAFVPYGELNDTHWVSISTKF